MPWRKNALLAAVAPEERALVESRSALQALETGQCLQPSGEVVGQVYFPVSGVVTIGAETPDGEVVHVAVLGHEGGLGVVEACGSRTAHCQGLVLVSGCAVRLTATAYRTLFGASERFRAAIHDYTETILVEARLSIACNALHSVEQRLAKTLLLLADRTDSDTVPVTHEALAQILGVQRTTVSAVLSSLQKQGLLQSRRGTLRIFDAAALKRASCSCRDAFAYAAREIQESPEPVCDA